jgi:hypothetical protein
LREPCIDQAQRAPTDVITRFDQRVHGASILTQAAGWAGGMTEEEYFKTPGANPALGAPTEISRRLYKMAQKPQILGRFFGTTEVEPSRKLQNFVGEANAGVGGMGVCRWGKYGGCFG